MNFTGEKYKLIQNRLFSLDTDNILLVLYGIFAAFLVSYNLIGLIFLYSPGGVDYWEHLASFYSFSRNILTPENPYLLTDQPSHLFTPYHLLWGAIAGIFQIHPFYLMPVIGIVNTLLFIISINIFSRFMFGHRKYALPLILTMLFFWLEPWEWSGFYNFGLFPLTSVYPYWFALPVSLILLARYGDKGSIKYTYFYIPILALVFIIHSLTGSFLLLMVVLKAILMRCESFKTKTILILAPVCAVLLSFLWPYFPVVEVIFKSGHFEEVTFAGKFTKFYDEPVRRILPALLGLPLLLYFILKRRYNLLTTGFLAVLLIYILNYFTMQNSVLARYIIFVTLFCQLAIVEMLKFFKPRWLFNIILILYIAVLPILGRIQIRPSLNKIGLVKDAVNHQYLGYHSNQRIFNKYRKLGSFLDRQDNVMATLDDSWLLPGIVGCKVVGVRHSNPFMYDYNQRLEKTKKFFDSGTVAQERIDILKQYGVSHILISEGTDINLLSLGELSNPVYRGEDFLLYKVKKN